PSEHGRSWHGEHRSMPVVVFFFLRLRRPPGPPLFPYTTLFRSVSRRGASLDRRRGAAVDYESKRARRSVQNPCRGRSSGRTFARDRKSTRLNSSHLVISYAVFCLKKKSDTLNNGRRRILTDTHL